MLLIGILFSLAGLVVYLDARRARRTPRSPLGGWVAVWGRVRGWTAVPGAVLVSGPEVPGHHRLAYEYEVGGALYQREQVVRLQVEVLSGDRRCTAGSLGPGDHLLVWYDPSSPQSATVVPAGNAWPSLPFILAGVGLALIFMALWPAA